MHPRNNKLHASRTNENPHLIPHEEMVRKLQNSGLFFWQGGALEHRKFYSWVVQFHRVLPGTRYCILLHYRFLWGLRNGTDVVPIFKHNPCSGLFCTTIGTRCLDRVTLCTLLAEYVWDKLNKSGNENSVHVRFILCYFIQHDVAKHPRYIPQGHGGINGIVSLQMNSNDFT